MKHFICVGRVPYDEDEAVHVEAENWEAAQARFIDMLAATMTPEEVKSEPPIVLYVIEIPGPPIAFNNNRYLTGG